MSGRANEFEEREPKPMLHSNQREQGQGSSLRHDKGALGIISLTPMEMSGGRVTNVNLETDRRSVHESYSYITRKVKIDVPSFDGRIDGNTFSDRIVAIQDYFDWYGMSHIEWVRFAKMKLVGPA